MRCGNPVKLPKTWFEAKLKLVEWLKLARTPNQPIKFQPLPGTWRRPTRFSFCVAKQREPPHLPLHPVVQTFSSSGCYDAAFRCGSHKEDPGCMRSVRQRRPGTLSCTPIFLDPSFFRLSISTTSCRISAALKQRETSISEHIDAMFVLRNGKLCPARVQGRPSPLPPGLPVASGDRKLQGCMQLCHICHSADDCAAQLPTPLFEPLSVGAYRS